VRVDDALYGDPDPRACTILYSDMRLQLDCTYADTARLVVTEIEAGLGGPASHEVTQFADDRADREAVFARRRRIAFARTSYLENRTDI
jgi:hypothetical protein